MTRVARADANEAGPFLTGSACKRAAPPAPAHLRASSPLAYFLLLARLDQLVLCRSQPQLCDRGSTTELGRTLGRKPCGRSPARLWPCGTAFGLALCGARHAVCCGQAA